MGWLLKIYLLDSTSMITILSFLSIGMTHPENNLSKGIFIGLFKWNLMLVIGKAEEIKLEESGYA
tara:strand:+ start:2393 stop:2587 length:195 start_codon:yes stop_codon:yes gene_type:complete